MHLGHDASRQAHLAQLVGAPPHQACTASTTSQSREDLVDGAPASTWVRSLRSSSCTSSGAVSASRPRAARRSPRRRRRGAGPRGAPSSRTRLGGSAEYTVPQCSQTRRALRRGHDELGGTSRTMHRAMPRGPAISSSAAPGPRCGGSRRGSRRGRVGLGETVSDDLGDELVGHEVALVHELAAPWRRGRRPPRRRHAACRPWRRGAPRSARRAGHCVPFPAPCFPSTTISPTPMVPT